MQVIIQPSMSTGINTKKFMDIHLHILYAIYIFINLLYNIFSLQKQPKRLKIKLQSNCPIVHFNKHLKIFYV